MLAQNRGRPHTTWALIPRVTSCHAKEPPGRAPRGRKMRADELDRLAHQRPVPRRLSAKIRHQLIDEKPHFSRDIPGRRVKSVYREIRGRILRQQPDQLACANMRAKDETGAIS